MQQQYREVIPLTAFQLELEISTAEPYIQVQREVHNAAVTKCLKKMEKKVVKLNKTKMI